MKVSYTINPVENSGFSAVGYEASLPPQAAADLDEPLCIVTDQPIPFELWQFADNSITPATGHMLEFKGEAIPVRCFRLRIAPVASFNKKARLQVFIPGKIHLGFTKEPKKAEKFLADIIPEITRKTMEAIAKKPAREIIAKTTRATLDTCEVNVFGRDIQV